jgi:hypothetical protein
MVMRVDASCGLNDPDLEKLPHEGTIEPGDIGCVPHGCHWLVIAKPREDDSRPSSYYYLGEHKFSIRRTAGQHVEVDMNRLAAQFGLSYERLFARDMDGVEDTLYKFEKK